MVGIAEIAEVAEKRLKIKENWPQTHIDTRGQKEVKGERSKVKGLREKQEKLKAQNHRMNEENCVCRLDMLDCTPRGVINPGWDTTFVFMTP